MSASPALRLNNDQWADRRWRLHNLYWITDIRGRKVKFVPNEAQIELLDNLWYLNIILKSRQRGFSTFVDILGLDLAVWQKNQAVGVIAHGLREASGIFKTKVKYPYDNLPEGIKEVVYPVLDSTHELALSNGSSVYVGTSMRSATVQFLHVSEFGKISRRMPEKAKEIVSGSFNAVHPGQMIFVESTAEGRGGEFFTMCQTAQKRPKGAKLTPLDFRFHFFPWFTDPQNVLDPALVVIGDESAKYFAELARLGIKLRPEQKAWYVKKAEQQRDRMKAEYPSCIPGHVLVSTAAGLVPMSEVKPDGKYITAKFDKGFAPVYLVRTKLGYECTSTFDHRYLCADGNFNKLSDIAVGQRISIRPQPEADFGLEPQTVLYSPAPFVEASITIDVDFGLFLGIYMGDGSFHDGCLSIACDAQDGDFIEIVKSLLRKFVAEPTQRIVGSKKGGLEIRVSRKALIEPFDALGLLRKNKSNNFKRNVCVPTYIKRSPRDVVAAFLRGIFETDGFAFREGTGVKLFSKYDFFLRDIQLLLLQFGITSRLMSADKINGAGYRYTGWNLTLRTEEGRRFWKEIGFISARKQARVAAMRDIDAPSAFRRTALEFVDEIASIEPVGQEIVYDITTSSAQFSAGGLVVHNSAKEAFEAAVDGIIFGKEMARARAQGRICTVPYARGYPVNTFWDLGLSKTSGTTALWCHQYVAMQHRFIKCHESHGQALDHYARWLQDTGYTFGVHFLPHDAGVRRLGKDTTKPWVDLLRELMPGHTFEVIPVIDEVRTGIDQTKAKFDECVFDEAGCEGGINALDNYQYEWDEAAGQFKTTPRHDWSSNYADAIRQFGQGWHPLDKSEPPPPVQAYGVLDEVAGF